MATVDELRSKLAAAGIPTELHGKFVEFQTKYAGRREDFGLNPCIWGVLFDSVHPCSGSLMVPGEVEADFEDGVWQVVCADVHQSDAMTIDQFGRLYYSLRPYYSDFNSYFEGKEPDLLEPRAT